MGKLWVCALFACAAVAQQKPPAKVDQALRARVKEFYQYHVDEQYRKAETLVANDDQSRDIFFTKQKEKYEKFEISQIEYRCCTGSGIGTSIRKS